MDIILYFAFGLLNIGLLYLVTNLYRRRTDIDLFPGRENEDKMEMILCWASYILSGPFGTAILVGLGVYLYLLCKTHYKK